MDSTQGVYPSATVLVVDDTPDNLMLIAELLKDKYRVKAANSGEKALRLLQADPLPDLILLDIMMPGLSGYDVAEQLKLDVRIRHIPIIFLTSMTATEDEIRGLSLGAADYITKPIIPRCSWPGSRPKSSSSPLPISCAIKTNFWSGKCSAAPRR